jgi:hypothetical protein
VANSTSLFQDYLRTNPALGAGLSLAYQAGLPQAVSSGVESVGETARQFSEQSAQDYSKFQQGSIGPAQLGLRAIPTGLEGSFGLFTDAADFLYRTAAPASLEKVTDFAFEKTGELIGQGIQTIKEAAKNTDVGRYLDENYPEETETALRLGGTAVDLLTLRFGADKVNEVAVNTDTKVENFYDNHKPDQKVKGAVKALGKGIERTFWSSLSPKDQAIFDQLGLSRGAREQAAEVVVALTKADKLQDQIDRLKQDKPDLGKLPRSERAQYADIAKTIKKLEEQQKALLSLPTYNMDTGAWKYAHYMLNYQLEGKASPFLEQTVGKVSTVADIDPKNKKDFDDKIWANPGYSFNQDQKDRLYRHIMIAQGLAGNDMNIKGKPTVLIEDPFSKSANIRNELTSGQGQSRTAKNVFLLGTKHNFQGMSPEKALELLKGRTLTKEEKTILSKPQPEYSLTDKSFTDLKHPAYKYQQARRKLAAEPTPSYDPKTNTIYFQTNINSSSKVHGGMNQFFALDLTTGKTTVVQSDRHDMFGMDPVGGNPLVIVFPPLQYDMKGNQTRNVVTLDKDVQVSKRKEAKEQRSSYLMENYGALSPEGSKQKLVDQRASDVQDLRKMKGQPDTYQSQMLDVLSPESQLLERAVSPSARDYAKVLGNVGGYGTTAGNLFEQLAIYPEEEQ